MRGPENSWEVSYVISVRKPHIKLGGSNEEFFRAVGWRRAKELRQWAEEEFDHYWLLQHI